MLRAKISINLICVRIKIYIRYILLLSFFSQYVFSQNPDSLKQALKNATHDTVRVKLLVELSDVCEIEEIDSYVTQALVLCNKNLKNKSINSRERFLLFKYAGAALNNKGFINDQIGNTDKAIVYYELALKMQEFINDQKGVAYSLNNIAFIYDNKGDVPKSLEYMHKALKIQESIQDKAGVAISFINIGNVLRAHGEESKAIDYFNKGLKMNEELQNNSHTAVALLNLGDVYYTKGDTANALINFNKAIALYEKEGDEYGLAYALVNRGHIYKKQHQYDKALAIFERSLNMLEKQGEKAGVAKTLVNIVEVLLKQNNINKASEQAQKGFKLSQELGYPLELKATSELLSKIYAQQGSYQKAYEMHCLYKLMEDSVNRQENRKASIQKGFQYEYEKKSTEDSLRVEAERKVFSVKIQQEKTQRVALYIGIILITLFSGFMYNRFRVTRKQKYIIESQKVEVEQQRELADNRRVIAEDQKNIIEQKQKEILDSIHYAKRIQHAMLTSEEYIANHFDAETFIFYQPKDIVSGDFYWALSHHNQFYISAADCTGHGVPGAFMSLLNISFLNGNVIERGLKNPAEILNEQRKEIIKALNPNGNENSKDGMDCALCAFDLKNNQLQFALANNPLWLIRENELIEYKADKMPVGMYEEVQKDFTLNTIEIKKGDCIYLLTDGYADQFGGDKGKKFKYKHLKDTLLANVNKPMEEQKYILSQTINTWKGNLEQVDDILIIGVRV
jgi:serine phosphatase RsbU (regulator of sigma subunit)/Flp pilus assembly protein TadD